MVRVGAMMSKMSKTIGIAATAEQILSFSADPKTCGFECYLASVNCL